MILGTESWALHPIFSGSIFPQFFPYNNNNKKSLEIGIMINPQLNHTFLLTKVDSPSTNLSTSSNYPIFHHQNISKVAARFSVTAKDIKDQYAVTFHSNLILF